MAVVSKSSVLNHSTACPIANAKVKTSLLTSDPGFRASVIAHGGKGAAKVMRTEAAKIGLGGDSVNDEILWRAQRIVRREINLSWSSQWGEMGRYFRKMNNAGIKAAVLCDADQVFDRAFVAFPAVYAAIKVGGRGVCSTDFGHMKHDWFGGLNALGLFQLGDGSIIPLWAAIFSEQSGSEDTNKWEWCAEQIRNAGMADVYAECVHFRDRHAGAPFFERSLGVRFGM